MDINKKILVFDNYDSFTYNLVHLIEKITDAEVDVFRNDEITLDAVESYQKIVLSPGPGIPEEAGLLLALIKRYSATKSILGVCLGHQAIGQAFGGNLSNLDDVYHGIATNIIKQKTTNQNTSIKVDILASLPNEILVGRYHSWVISDENFPQQSRQINQPITVPAINIPIIGFRFSRKKGMRAGNLSMVTSYARI